MTSIWVFCLSAGVRRNDVACQPATPLRLFRDASPGYLPGDVVSGEQPNRRHRRDIRVQWGFWRVLHMSGIAYALYDKYYIQFRVKFHAAV